MAQAASNPAYSVSFQGQNNLSESIGQCCPGVCQGCFEHTQEEALKQGRAVEETEGE